MNRTRAHEWLLVAILAIGVNVSVLAVDGDEPKGDKPGKVAKPDKPDGAKKKGDKKAKADKPTGKYNKVVAIGQKAPRWNKLTGTDGKAHGFRDHRKAKVIVVCITCNGCPVAVAYEDRQIQFAKDYAGKGVDFVAISVQDSIEKMTERAKKKGFNFPYLLDPTQRIGHRLGATVTPQYYVLDKARTIAYMGAFDNSQRPDKVTKNYLRDAVDALLTGKKVEVAETRQFGCGVKYKAKPGKAREGKKHDPNKKREPGKKREGRKGKKKDKGAGEK